ncbi:hypothetical protein CRUP_008171, partial [Coryphaenoides rupestris]
MFIEDTDWNDEQASQALSKPLLNKAVEKSNGKIKFKVKGVGKKSLLRTLQTLGSAAAPDQKGDGVQKEDSGDSEPEESSAPARPKRKKKRNRGRKKTNEGETETAGLDDDKKKANSGPKEIKKKDGKKEVVEVVEVKEEEDNSMASSKRQKFQKLHKETLKRKSLLKMLQSQPDKAQLPSGNQDPEEEEEEVEVVEVVQEVQEEGGGTAAAPEDRSASLRCRMEQRLEAARFRYINEVLYTSSSGEAKRMFSQDPQAFGVYHKGFTAQVQRWPANPVDAIIAYIQNKYVDDD